MKKSCPTCNQFHKQRYVCPSCCRPLERLKAQYYWRGVVMHGWVCPDCNSLWDIGGAFVRYVEKRTKADE